MVAIPSLLHALSQQHSDRENLHDRSRVGNNALRRRAPVVLGSVSVGREEGDAYRDCSIEAGYEARLQVEGWPCGRFGLDPRDGQLPPVTYVQRNWARPRVAPAETSERSRGGCDGPARRSDSWAVHAGAPRERALS